MSRALFWVCGVMAALFFLAGIALSLGGVTCWQAPAMGGFFLLLAYVHHRALR